MAEKLEFLFILPEGPAGDEIREQQTALHEEFVAETKDFWLAGAKGPIFKEHNAGKPPQFNGSWVLLHAASQQEAVDLLQRDPFTTAQIWDWNKAQIFSVKSGLRVPFVKNSIKIPIETA